jgi:hypothetical protein
MGHRMRPRCQGSVSAGHWDITPKRKTKQKQTTDEAATAHSVTNQLGSDYSLHLLYEIPTSGLDYV